ncbi:phosphatase PAP2 family protein [Sphingobium chlorophenolicum]|nr:phosphatase PAP2 family protein [Sphingobium chlorophenolicum]
MRGVDLITAAIARINEHARAVKQQDALHPMSRTVYLILFVWCMAWISVFALSDFIVGQSALYSSFGSICLIAGCGALARRYGHARIALFLEACSVPAIAAALSGGTIIMLASISSHFVDPQLIGIDAALGFDWRAIFRFYLAYPGIVPLSEAVYSSFQPQFLLLPVALCVWRPELLWTYITAYVFSLLLAAAIFPFAAAEGPYVYYGIPQGVMPSVGDDWPWQWYQGKWISQLQNGEIRDLSRIWPGLIQFPSFHSAAAVLFIWATHGIRLLRWPGLLLNIGVILSTFISGAHYLSDVLAGCSVAILSIWAANRMTALRIRQTKHQLNQPPKSSPAYLGA